MNTREVEQLELARRAVGRWAAFPVDAEPRPVVLAESVISSQGGLRGQRAREAWSKGRYRWAVDVPHGVQELAKQSADLPCLESERAPLLITEAERTTRTFLSDRGPVVLPAYRLQGPTIIESLWVLDPEADFWQPDAAASAPGLGAPSLMRSPWDRIEVETDGYTITLPWRGGSLWADYRVQLFETTTAISAVAIPAPKPNARKDWSAGPDQVARAGPGRTAHVSVRLSKPIGNRVFVDLRGEAMQVTMSGPPTRSTA